MQTTRAYRALTATRRPPLLVFQTHVARALELDLEGTAAGLAASGVLESVVDGFGGHRAVPDGFAFGQVHPDVVARDQVLGIPGQHKIATAKRRSTARPRARLNHLTLLGAWWTGSLR